MNTKEVQAAIISLPVGTKFSHPNFGSDEYIVADENRVAHTEDGYECSAEFWEIRKDWDGWYIKEENEETEQTTLFENQPNTYMFHNYYNYPNRQVEHQTYCANCKLLRDNDTCPYSKKTIKLKHSTSCKYGVPKN